MWWLAYTDALELIVEVLKALPTLGSEEGLPWRETPVDIFSPFSKEDLGFIF